jgi:UDP-N-acetylglucosamine 1-carboxyvinyltransferase
MSRILVRPRGPLSGATRALGAKNAVLKQMAACLLASGENRISNVPVISDVVVMSDLLTELGCDVRREDNDIVVVVPNATELRPKAPPQLFAAMRASLVVLAPLLTRCGRVEMALPGGDDFGQRPINFHIDGLSAMGARFHNDRTLISGDLPDGRLQGARVTLEYPSHTATDNLLMAAVLARGRSVIDNAAREPEVEDLGRQLIAMGARIEGLGTSRLHIEGVDVLTPAHHSAITDRVVVATYLAAAVMTGGDVRVLDARADHMENLLRKFASMGATVDISGEGVAVRGPFRVTAVDVATLPYPGVATDYKPLVTTMLSVADGVSVVTENLFDGRFRYVEELVRLGANIQTEGHHALVRGVDRLVGSRVRASDIRAGAALSIAGLVATGETDISGFEHIERGYDDFVGRLSSLGADVELVG